MTPVPPNPKLYHITPVDNLPNILRAGELRSDARMVAAGGAAVTIGMSKLKLRRLTELHIDCLGNVMVGDCVPFYFCPRSVMLYLIHMRNSEVAYTGGQGPIVHLEADLKGVLSWARAHGRPWAFSLSNAASRYAEFRADAAQLDQIDWEAVQTTSWQGVRDRKQAEFLVLDTFPWELVQVLGVHSSRVGGQVQAMLDQAEAQQPGLHRPLVQYKPGWYY